MEFRKLVASGICLIMGLAITGCSSSSDDQLYELEQSKNVLSDKVLSTEELLKIGMEDFSSCQTSEDKIQTRAISSTLVTIYGYTSQQGEGNFKYLIPNEISNSLGISRGIYIAEKVTCTMEIKIEGLGTTKFFSPATSSSCGLMPNGSNFTRGYTSTTPDSDGKMVLSTYLIHIICDMSGRNYDMWYPCKPANIEWNYNLVQ